MFADTFSRYVGKEIVFVVLVVSYSHAPVVVVEVTKHEPPSSRSGRVEKPESAPSVSKKEKSKPHCKHEACCRNRLGPRKPPTRRIQRPTSIRRPKLIGKSVEGAAAQAMAASRARASANRGSSPFQKAAKTSSKTKEDVGSDLEAAASNTVPSTVEASSKDIKKHVVRTRPGPASISC